MKRREICRGKHNRKQLGSRKIDGVVDIRLIQADPDPTEVQGNERQIAIQKCVSAYESVKYTGALTIDIDFVITEDVGLRLDCLNGFPGPYCKPMIEDELEWKV